MPELGCSGTPPPACGAACTGPRTHLLGGPLAEGGTGHGSACATAAARPFECGRHGSDRAPWLPPAAWVLGHRGLRRPQEAPGISHCPQCGVLAATSPGPRGPGCPTPPGVSPPTASRVSAGPRRGCGTSSKADACRHRVPRATGPKGPGCHQLLERGHPTSHTPLLLHWPAKARHSYPMCRSPGKPQAWNPESHTQLKSERPGPTLQGTRSHGSLHPHGRPGPNRIPLEKAARRPGTLTHRVLKPDSPVSLTS